MEAVLRAAPVLPGWAVTALGGSCAALLLLGILSRLLAPARVCLRGKHVLIPGGSMGIGEECAKIAVREGASVTILARGKDRLAAAKASIEAAAPSRQKVHTVSADVTSFEATEQAVRQAVEMNGPVDVMLVCVGLGTSKAFEEMPAAEAERLMQVNWLAPLHLVKAVLPSMKRTRGPSCICFCSTQAAQIGVYGYAAYSSAKRALVGLAEVLHQELSVYNIRMSVCYPPDTETPGFAEENKSKPELTKVISETGSVFSAQEVAQKLVVGVKRGDFNISVGFDGWLLSQLNATALPQPFLHKLLIEATLCGPLRIVAWGYKLAWQWTITDWHKKQKKKS